MAGVRHRSSASPLALAWAALVVYASLYPFEGWRWPPGQALPALLALPWAPWVVVFDLWANFLGYVPLGALLLIAARRGGQGGLTAFVLALITASALSYATEVAQHFLPGRHPSLKDWAMNSAGGAAGAALGAALYGLGWVDRWHALRERWFVRQSAGALALMALWPLGLLFPAPVPLGLGQVGPRLRESLAEVLDGVPWAEGAHALLVSVAPDDVRLWPLAEAAASALGLLAPCLLAFAVSTPGWRRALLVLGAALVGAGAMTLSTLLNFGPEHALAWLTPATLRATLAGALAALLLAWVGRRLAAALALVALAVGVTLVAQAPADPYFAQSLQAWEQGRFVRFHGIAQWIGWLWPYAAMAWLLTRLSSRA